MRLSQTDILEYVVSNMQATDAEVASVLGYSRAYVTATLNKFLHYVKGPEEISERKKNNYRKSKLGARNPMKGKFGSAHHYYKGVISDGKGYEMILRPEWWTGDNKRKHIFYHHVVYCLDRGLTCVPKGFCIHHIDENKINNSPNNLIMLSLKDHTRLHSRLKNLQNVSRRDT